MEMWASPLFCRLFDLQGCAPQLRPAPRFTNAMGQGFAGFTLASSLHSEYLRARGFADGEMRINVM